MNLVLAVSLLTVGFSYGRWLPTYLTVEDMEAASARGEIDLTLGVLIEDVMSGGAAAKVGVPPKSILKAIDGVEITKPTEVVPLQEEKWRVTYTLLTGEEFDSEETYRVVLQEGKTGVVLTSTALDLVVPKRGIMQGFALALRETKVMTVQTVLGIGRLVSSLTRTGTVPEGIAGIVGIYQLTHSSVQEGLMTYLRLVALLSLSLAVLNILPFPALDGGRLLFVLAEFVSRRPLNRRFELTTNAIGFTVLILLILIITIYDVARLF